MRSAFLGLVCVVMAGGWGCSSGGGGGAETAAPDASPEAIVDAAPEAAGDDVTPGDALPEVLADVVSDPGPEAAPDVAPEASVTVRTRKYDGTPVTGFQVALDWPDGTRFTGAVDADGKVELPGWVGAPGVYTALTWIDPWDASNAFLFGRYVATDVTEIVLLTNGPVPPAPEVVKVGGTANLEDPKHMLTVTGEPTTTYNQKVGPAWSLNVEKGKPFTLVATEWEKVSDVPPRSTAQDLLKWKTLSHDAVSESTTLDLDFTTPDEAFPFAGTLGFPGQPGELIHDQSTLVVVTYSRGNAQVGLAESTGPNADGTGFEFSGQYVKPFPEADVMTYYNLSWAYETNYLRSASMVPGYPGAAPDASEFLSPMTVEAPALWTNPAATEPIAWSGDRQGADLTLRAFRPDGTLRWWMFVDEGITSVTLPPLPEGHDYATLLGANSLMTFRLVLCTPFAAELGLVNYCRLYTESRPFLIKQP